MKETKTVTYYSDVDTPDEAFELWKAENPDAEVTGLVDWYRDRVQATAYGDFIHRYVYGLLVLEIPISVEKEHELTSSCWCNPIVTHVKGA